jgi:hypothetical protein
MPHFFALTLAVYGQSTKTPNVSNPDKLQQKCTEFRQNMYGICF